MSDAKNIPFTQEDWDRLNGVCSEQAKTALAVIELEQRIAAMHLAVGAAAQHLQRIEKAVEWEKEVREGAFDVMSKASQNLASRIVALEDARPAASMVSAPDRIRHPPCCNCLRWNPDTMGIAFCTSRSGQRADFMCFIPKHEDDPSWDQWADAMKEVQRGA